MLTFLTVNNILHLKKEQYGWGKDKALTKGFLFFWSQMNFIILGLHGIRLTNFRLEYATNHSNSIKI